jgi:hypothetical protein
MSKNRSLPEARKTKQRRLGVTLKQQEPELISFCSGDYMVTRPGREAFRPT